MAEPRARELLDALLKAKDLPFYLKNDLKRLRRQWDAEDSEQTKPELWTRPSREIIGR